MITHELLSGEVIEYDAPPELAAFVEEVRRLSEQPTITEDALVAVIYSARNPLLDTQRSPGRAVVTREAYQNPAYHVLLDLLERVRLREHKASYEDVRKRFSMTVHDAAKQLGITENAVRQAIERSRLSAIKEGGTYYIDPASVASYRVSRRGPSAAAVQPAETEPAPPTRRAAALAVYLGSGEGISFQVKHPGELVGRRKAGSTVTGSVDSWSRVAVLVGEGEKARYLVLEPADEEQEVNARGFYVRGRFRVSEQIRKPVEARAAFKAFKAE